MTIQVSTVPEVGNLGTQTKVDRSAYLTGLLHLRPELTEATKYLQDVRDRATARVQELAIPSTRDEEWRFTDLSPLLEVQFSAPNSSSTVSPSEIQSFALPESDHSRLVVLNGVYSPGLSDASGLPPDVFVGNLSDAYQSSLIGDKIPQYFAKQQGAEETFTALNTACLTDAVVIWVPRNQLLGTPIHVLFVSTGVQPAAIAHPRCLVVAESGSSLTLIEEYVSLAEGSYFNNAVTEVWLQSNAQVDHTRVQRENVDSFHIGKTAVSQARDSRYACHAVSLGSAIARHNLEVYQLGEQTETTLNGLTLIAGRQVSDTHSAIAYTKPHSSSRQLHKCIVDDRAHAVFNGKVFVPKAAQLTDAGQLSKNLLLSSKARIDTKPQLEITADNVKCSHGATVSQLDQDEVFYLQSRGIDEASSRKLLVYAFAYEVIREIPIHSLRDTLAVTVRAQQSHV